MEWQITERKIAEMKRLQKETELLALMTQVNPHFMLNGLNTIYGMAVEKHEKLPKMIMDFSDILKYNLYLGSKEKVPLHEELGLIRKYIDFQKSRSTSDLQINYAENLQNPDEMVSPYLFLPFVENAFKHSSKNQAGKYFVDIKIKQNSKTIFFTQQNSIRDHRDRTVSSHGLGLKNVKDRLKMKYPDNHLLKITQDDNTFDVKLEFST